MSKVCLPAQSAHTSAPIRTGDRVAARYQAAKYGVALTKWYPGVALCVHSDGSCDVRFDDGDTEDHVPPQFVRAMRPAHDGGGGDGAEDLQSSQEGAEGQVGHGGGPEDIDQQEGQGAGKADSEGEAQDGDDASWDATDDASQLSIDSSAPLGS